MGRSTSVADGHRLPADTPVLVLDPFEPLRSARAYVNATYKVDSFAGIQYQRGVFYGYSAAHGSYHELEEATVRSGLYLFLDRAKRPKHRNAPRGPAVVPFRPTKANVENALDALRAICALPGERAAPCWLEQEEHGLDPIEILPFHGGLLHIPTRRVFEATPKFFSLAGLDFCYDPVAPRPAEWLRFLGELWPDDAAARDLLQEWFGYQLTPATKFQKILMLVGPKRSGKGTIARVMKRLLGTRHVCGPTLGNMAQQFGLATLIGKTAAIIADARIGGRADTSMVTERLLSISGEDTLSIPRKHLPDWNGKLPTRFTLMTNELPRLEDASGALASRFLVLQLTQSFYGIEDADLEHRFEHELPGILNWALDGRSRLYDRGHFLQPDSSGEIVRLFEDLGSPITAFIRDSCEVHSTAMVPSESLFDAWKAWCTETGRERAGTIQMFGRNLRAAVPWLSESQPRVCGRRIRFYKGIGLKPDE